MEGGLITLDELKQIMPHAGSRAETFHEPLSQAMDEFEINSPLRMAAFLAQIAHESGSLKYVREIASGEAYEGRSDLGNNQRGDGVRFRGRGLIQVTGRANYAACGEALGLDLLAEPELLERPDNAARSAGWFWGLKRLNELADKEDFKLITKRINGGYNGYQERLAYYERAKRVLG
jgi:putative chitinase